MTYIDVTEGEIAEMYRRLVADDAQTCYACPSQWEGRLHDGRHFYFRYRSGWASLAIYNEADVVNGRADFELQVGDALRGFMGVDEYKATFLRLLAMEGAR